MSRSPPGPEYNRVVTQVAIYLLPGMYLGDDRNIVNAVAEEKIKNERYEKPAQNFKVCGDGA